MEIKCPICETKIEIAADARSGQRLTCPNCFAQLAVFSHQGKRVLGCAICKEPLFDPGNCEDCERRRERKKILEAGEL